MKVQETLSATIERLTSYAAYQRSRGGSADAPELMVQILDETLHHADCRQFWNWVDAQGIARRTRIHAEVPPTELRELGPDLLRALWLWVAYCESLGCPSTPTEAARLLVEMSLDDNPDFRTWQQAQAQDV